MDDQEQPKSLVERAKNGDREAFDRLFERYRGRLGSYLRAVLGDIFRRGVSIDDVLQDTAIRAYGSLPGFRWSGEEPFVHWLSTIARHVTYGYRRRTPPDLQIPSGVDVEAGCISPLRALEREDRFERLKAAIRSLKPEYRDVILLARIRRLPIAEVAAKMGRTPMAVTQLLRRALKKLRLEFGDTGSFGLPHRSLEEDGESHV
jgi:RNA polymerase sigma-70 factor (ECF subfamily)